MLGRVLRQRRAGSSRAARSWVRPAAWVAGGGAAALVAGRWCTVHAEGPDAVPPFNPDACRFDQGTFSGRLQQIIVQLDPMKLFVGTAEIEAAVALLKSQATERSAEVSDRQLWDAKELIDCRVHPDTGELIATPFCFAAYTPMQPPIIVGLLTASSPVAVAFWQWFNQSYNAAVFYSSKIVMLSRYVAMSFSNPKSITTADKSVSSPMGNAEIATAYCAAVSAAVGVGVGARQLGARMGSGALGRRLVMFAPFLGVVIAGCTNLLCMRNDELRRGVIIRDAAGNEVGLSKCAAREGLAKCCLARVFCKIVILSRFACCPSR